MTKFRNPKEVCLKSQYCYQCNCLQNQEKGWGGGGLQEQKLLLIRIMHGQVNLLLTITMFTVALGNRIGQLIGAGIRESGSFVHVHDLNPLTPACVMFWIFAYVMGWEK